MSFPDRETLDLIRWWEQEISSEQRTILMEGYIWHGSKEERHKKLREMHSKFLEKQTKRTT